MTAPPVAALDAALDRERIAADLMELVAIGSVGGFPEEQAVQDRLAEWLSELGAELTTWTTHFAELSEMAGFPGAECERASLRGVVARFRGGPGPSLLLLGHSDVVPAPGWHDAFAPGREGNRVIGRGAADMKGGIVSVLHAVRALRAVGVDLPGDLLVATVSAEEDGGAGTFDLLHRGIHADACVIAEPSDGAIVTANAGALGFRLEVRGVSAHAAHRWEGVDALDVLATVRAALAQLEARLGAGADAVLAGWPVPYPTVIGTVHGGSWSSTVMDHLVAEGRFGAPLELSVQQARSAFEDAVNDSVNREFGDSASVTVSWAGGQFAPARQDPDGPIVRTVARAHAAVTGSEAGLAGTTYGSDLRLVLGAGIPAVLYGPGSVEQAHSDGEWIDIEDLVRCALVYALVAGESGADSLRS